MAGILWVPPAGAPSLLLLRKEGKWVFFQVWSALGQEPTAPPTGQPWSTLHRLALGTQPRDNGAIHVARALHNDPLALSPWLDGERVSAYGVWG